MYEVAPVESPQSSVGEVLCPVAPFAGDSSEKLPGGEQICPVVNDQLPLLGARDVCPHEFVATTYQ